MHRAGAEIAMTYLNERARPYVEPLAQAVDAQILMPLEVREFDAGRLAVREPFREMGPALCPDTRLLLLRVRRLRGG